MMLEAENLITCYQKLPGKQVGNTKKPMFIGLNGGFGVRVARKPPNLPPTNPPSGGVGRLVVGVNLKKLKNQKVKNEGGLR